MITPAEKSYKDTKQIMLGDAAMNPDFRDLADFIDSVFAVKTINIIYDSIGKDKRPRLNICFEYEREKRLFYREGGPFNIDQEKQQLIAAKFGQILGDKKMESGSKWGRFLSPHRHKKYTSSNALIVYSAFEQLAKMEANESIPSETILRLERMLDNPNIWVISKMFSSSTFFLYTDLQVKEFENSTSRELWTNKYFDLLKSYDQFDYFERDKFNISLDSKENFDNNFQSNWLYYYK